jgi:acyl-CoA thioester hydrolase
VNARSDVSVVDPPRAAHATGPRFTWPVRAYYHDTDAGGIVYHGRCLDWFERCRMEWLRAMDCAAADCLARHGTLFVVRSAALVWHRPVRLDALADVSLAVERVGGATIDLDQRVHHAGQLAVEGRLVLATVAADTLRPARLPRPLRDALTPWLPEPR